MDSTVRQPNGLRSTFRIYLELTKLRIVLLLLFTTVTTMIVAARGIPDIDILLPTLIGGAFAAAGASAINQYLDRDMDAKMTRTARRPIPSGRIAPVNALLFGVGLVLWSVVILALFVNVYSAALAFGGAIYYIIGYTILLKRNTVVNIIIGGGAGAFPVLVGWAAATGTLSVEAFILFAIIFYWTPPHSWALAILVNTDYARANVPMMPVAHGEAVTRQQILYYSIQLWIITLIPGLLLLLPAVPDMLGPIYLVAAAILGFGMVRMAMVLINVADKPTARRLYKYSTAYLAFLFLAMIVDRIVMVYFLA